MKAVLALCLLGHSALAASVVAVLPLRDLAGGRPNIGAALRETLTTDLTKTKDVKVVERAAIDRVMREQDASRDVEGVAGVRLGTLLGATHLVTGAYQRDGNRLRVTARVVVVETGVIAGSAKIDGGLDELMALQDRLDAELLRAMGWKERPPHHVRARVTPRAVELFGDAALTDDVEKKKQLLCDAVQASPQFDYAADALAELEGRLTTYDAQHAVLLNEKELALGKGHKLAELFVMERNARRYHALLLSLDAAPKDEQRAYYTFLALEGLRRIDDALAAGERLLHDHADSPHYAEVEKRLRELARTRRAEHEARAAYDKDLAETRGAKDAGERDWGPCIAARWNHQYNQLMVNGCTAYLAKHGSMTDADSLDHAKAARLFLVLAHGELGQLDQMKAALADFRKRYPAGDEEIDAKLATWPTD